MAGGKDISHWFNPKTKDIRTHVDPMAGSSTSHHPCHQQNGPMILAAPGGETTVIVL